MIKINNLSYSFPYKDLYHEISFTLTDGQHCAFIGTSGNGKSTLIDLMMHPDNYMFDGKLEIAPDCRIGYVSQFFPKETAKEVTVFAYVAESFTKLQQELISLCAEMSVAVEIDSLLEKYQQVLDSFQAIDGDNFESNINKKLNLANLNKHKYQSISKLSNGEFKLVQIIKEMLSRPNLLIMDEPDAYLDFENINSLKNLINAHNETMLVITHNRYLLNHCFNKILHLENMELQEFDGNFTDYNLSILERKIELQELANRDALEIERNTNLINQLRTNATQIYSAAKGKTLHARVKMQERLESRSIKAPFVEITQPNIQFTLAHEIEDTIILKVHDYTVAFEDELLTNVNFEIKSTDKVALVGPNGTGKTTLLREIFKNNHSSIQLHEEVNMAYLSQLQGEALTESNTILEEFLDFGFKTNSEVISYLSEYGFVKETLMQKIHSLSGGEKTTLQLAKIATGNANLLLLDEPSSHLDTYAQIALEHAMKNYKGAILMISHDFYSIVNSTDFILWIEHKTIRKMSTRKFRKIMYSLYFDCDYLELEQKKKSTETQIAHALKDNDFEFARTLLYELINVPLI
ncbi:MAG: ATP-binding cassette domain-containing protein [Lachnospiraceae bacterium]